MDSLSSRSPKLSSFQPLTPLEDEVLDQLSLVIDQHIHSPSLSRKSSHVSRASADWQNSFNKTPVEVTFEKLKSHEENDTDMETEAEMSLKLPIDQVKVPPPSQALVAHTLANQRSWRVPWRDSKLGYALNWSTRIVRGGIKMVNSTTSTIISTVKTVGSTTLKPTKTLLNIAQPVEGRLRETPTLTPLLTKLLDIFTNVSGKSLDALDTTVSAGLGFVTFVMDLLGDTVQDPTGGILGSFFEFLDLLKRELGQHPRFKSIGMFRIARALACWWSIQSATNGLWIKSLDLESLDVRKEVKKLKRHGRTASQFNVKLTVQDPDAGRGLVDIVQGVLDEVESDGTLGSESPERRHDSPTRDKDVIDFPLLLRYAPLSHGAYGSHLVPFLRMLNTARKLIPEWLKGGVRGVAEKVHDVMDIYDTEDIDFDDETVTSPTLASPSSPTSQMPQPRSFDDLLRIGIIKSPSTPSFEPIPNTASPGQDSWAHPTFYILEDVKNKEIVLTLRGTASLHEIMVDLTCAYTPFVVPANGETVLCHGGILLAASYLVEENSKVVQTLNQVLERRQGWNLTIVGHSLGAALAAILSLCWADPSTCLTMENVGLPPGRRLRVFAYGMPCTFDARGCAMTAKMVTSVIVSTDFISRLCVGTVTDLRDIVIALCEDEGTLSEISKQLSAVQQGDEEALLWLWSLRKSLMATLTHARDYRGKEDDLHHDMDGTVGKLYPPGKLVWIREADSTSRIPSERWNVYRVKQREAVFGELLFGELMILDHLPSVNEEALRDLMDEL